MKYTSIDPSTPLVNGVHCLRCSRTPSQIYPMITIRRKMRRYNRVVYEDYHKIKLLQSQWVLHHCDNPRCVEPLHLFLGDPAINMADKVRKNRQAKGERIGRKTLTATDAKAIFADPRVHHVIARDYGVWRSTVSYIKRGRIWGHVTGV